MSPASSYLQLPIPSLGIKRTMRQMKRTMRQSSAKTHIGKNFTANNIWKTLLLFTAVVFLIFVYVTQNVLVSPDVSHHHDFSSPMGKGNDRVDDNSKKMKMKDRHNHQNHDGNGVGKNDDDKNHPVTIQPLQNAESDNIQAVVSVLEARNATTNITLGGETEAVNEIKYSARQKAVGKHKRERLKRERKKREAENSNHTLSPEEKLKYSFEETALMPNVSNALYFKDIPPEYLVEDPSVYLWDRAEAMIPEWMKDYFRWHRWKRSTWKDRNSTNGDWWKTERWMISQCLMEEDKKNCGGTADRLKPIPTLLRIAYENKRIYLIRWTRPTLLEAFLVPPTGGFDWRLPTGMAEIMDDSSNGKKLRGLGNIKNYAAGGMSLVRVRYQVLNPKYAYNDLVLNETVSLSEIGAAASIHQPNNDENDEDRFGFDAVFSRMWRIFFTPSPPIQAILRSKLANLDLVPNEYVGSHLRALYAIDTRPTSVIHRFTENALACSTVIFPGVPIFFASDSTIALQHAQEFNGKEIHEGDLASSMKLKVVIATVTKTSPNPPASREGNKNAATAAALSQPWHLDSFLGPIENFYDTFVDLYLLAMAGCVTYSQGGFGHWGMLIGGHVQCSKRQCFIAGRKKKDFCSFNATESNGEKDTMRFNSLHPSVFGKDDLETGPLFLPPMD